MRQLAAMFERESDRHDAVDEEERDQYVGQGKKAAKRVPQEQPAGRQRRDRREQCPQIARCPAGSERRDEAYRPADKEQPAEKDRRRQTGQGRYGNRSKPKDRQDDSFNQVEQPVLPQGLPYACANVSPGG